MTSIARDDSVRNADLRSSDVKRLSKRNIREVLRLRAEGFSEREIARSVGCARLSVQIGLWRADQAGVIWPLAPDQHEGTLEALLYPRRPPGVEVHPTPDFEWIERELKRKRVTRRQLWRASCDRARLFGCE